MAVLVLLNPGGSERVVFQAALHEVRSGADKKEGEQRENAGAEVLHEGYSFAEDRFCGVIPVQVHRHGAAIAGLFVHAMGEVKAGVGDVICFALEFDIHFCIIVSAFSSADAAVGARIKIDDSAGYAGSILRHMYVIKIHCAPTHRDEDNHKRYGPQEPSSPSLLAVCFTLSVLIVF